jgi:hypothetical protein
LPNFGFGEKDPNTGDFITPEYIAEFGCTNFYPNKYWMCVAGLVGLMLTFRGLTIFVLEMQRCKFKKPSGDTRNQHYGSGGNMSKSKDYSLNRASGTT